MKHLFTVSDVFSITGRGCVMVPGAPCEPDSPVVRLNAPLMLRLPDGRELTAHVRGIEMINYRKKPDRIACPLLLPVEFTKEDVPIGTEVFLLDLADGALPPKG